MVCDSPLADEKDHLVKGASEKAVLELAYEVVVLTFVIRVVQVLCECVCVCVVIQVCELIYLLYK